MSIIHNIVIPKINNFISLPLVLLQLVVFSNLSIDPSLKYPASEPVPCSSTNSSCSIEINIVSLPQLNLGAAGKSKQLVNLISQGPTSIIRAMHAFPGRTGFFKTMLDNMNFLHFM